jgi:hypothetical protein
MTKELESGANQGATKAAREREEMESCDEVFG